jgi:hypothetical protein
VAIHIQPGMQFLRTGLAPVSYHWRSYGASAPDVPALGGYASHVTRDAPPTRPRGTYAAAGLARVLQ